MHHLLLLSDEHLINPLPVIFMFKVKELQRILVLTATHNLKLEFNLHGLTFLTVHLI